MKQKEKETPLNTLGLSPDYTPQELKKAFKELAFKYHPDRNPNNPVAEERFKEIAAAYAYLTGNHELYQGLKQAHTSTVEIQRFVDDIFDDIFGVDPEKWTPPGKDIYLGLSLTLQEAYRGVSKTVSLWREKICEKCNGKGAPPGTKSPTCTYCFGRGAIQLTRYDQKVDQLCPKCQGLGRLPIDYCRLCKGRGVFAQKEKVKVTIPPLSYSGAQIRISGEGSLASRSQNPGDLILQISLLPNSVFQVKGGDILCHISISPRQALKGVRLKIPTLEGKKIYYLPPVQQSETFLRFEGKGLGGDQWVKISVNRPERFLALKSPSSLQPKKRFWSRIKHIFR